MGEAPAKIRRGGRYCVAGGPNNVGCSNSSYSDGISMHQFPRDRERRSKWIKFVQQHRRDFVNPGRYAALCSAHFTEDCFVRSCTDLVGMKFHRKLERNAIPTRAVQQESSDVLSDRAKRQIKRGIIGDIQRKKKQKLDHVPEQIQEIAPPSSTAQMEEEITQSAYAKSQAGTQSCQLPEVENSLSICPTCEQKSKKIRSTLTHCRRLKKQLRELKQRVRELEEKVALTESEYESDEVVDDDKTDDADRDQHVATDHSDVFSGEFHASVDEYDSESDNDADRDQHVTTDDSDVFSDEFHASVDEYDSESDNDDVQDSENYIRVEPETTSQEEPKFIVFYSTLLSIFSLFCFKCKEGTPQVSMKSSGTMVTVIQHCSNCLQDFTWQSQPLLRSKYPAGNILLSLSILLAGASISKIQLVFRHMGLVTYNVRTFFRHQKFILFPSIIHHWENYQNALISQLQHVEENVWCGDGRFDSMGHSAKYGIYTMFSSSLNKICHFEIVQANETSGSQQTELEGCKRCFSFLKEMGINISIFISDRHKGVAKWIRESCPQTSHFYDIWHIARTVSKKLLKASKEKSCEVIAPWIKAVRNHLYWCATSTKQGFGELIVAKWTSFIRHVANKHDKHPDKLYSKCNHGRLDPRKWIKIGTAAYDKLQSILLKTCLVNDIKKLSPHAQTSCLEGFHSTLNHWHPKMLCFSWMGTLCRHILASLHFNENLQRQTQKRKDGTTYVKVTYPKYKDGNEVVKEISCPPSYNYVDAIKKVTFSLSKDELSKISERYLSMVPEPLTEQFPDRLTKDQALCKKEKVLKRLNTQLHPSAKKQETLQSLKPSITQHATRLTSSSKKRQPHCKSCLKPMLGHTKATCTKKK